MKVQVIINPISGTGGRPSVAQRRAEIAAAVLSLQGVQYQVHITERSGHAYELARVAVDEGTSIVFAWGGDGTMNEVARAVAFSPTALAIIPAGSGNGLARELHVPLQPKEAILTALGAPERRVDVGELDGRFFFNAAGVGFDAHITTLFNMRPQGQRGLRAYTAIALRELFTYQPRFYTLTTGGETVCARALIVALANSRQYGNGAVVAPTAQLDDGELDLVVIAARSPWAILKHAPRLFTGTITNVPDVVTKRVRDLIISGDEPLLYHVDGEPLSGGTLLTARIHPRALRIRTSMATV